MLEAANIVVRYGPSEVVSGVTFDLRRGEIVTLLGPNGAGKTSLIRSLNGTVPLASGTVQINGRSINELSRREISQRVAVVAQENETKFPVTVLEYVLAARFANGPAFGWESEHDVAAAERAMASCELEGMDQRLMNELSGGERQRVVLARALAAEADVLLLDEPTANLDLAHQAMMFRLVSERCKTGGGAAMIITHDLNLASEFADRIMLLKAGRSHALGTPDQVLSEQNVAEVFGVNVMLDANPASGKLRITPVFRSGL